MLDAAERRTALRAADRVVRGSDGAVVVRTCAQDVYLVLDGFGSVAIDGIVTRHVGPGDTFCNRSADVEPERTMTVRAAGGLALAGFRADRFRALVGAVPALEHRMRGALVMAQATAATLDAVEDARALSPVTPLAMLTRTELRVASAAAEGLTNRAIAERLFVSPYTVQSHLRSAYAKTGVTSRVQLAALLLRAS